MHSHSYQQLNQDSNSFHQISLSSLSLSLPLHNTQQDSSLSFINHDYDNNEYDYEDKLSLINTTNDYDDNDDYYNNSDNTKKIIPSSPLISKNTESISYISVIKYMEDNFNIKDLDLSLHRNYHSNSRLKRKFDEFLQDEQDFMNNQYINTHGYTCKLDIPSNLNTKSNGPFPLTKKLKMSKDHEFNDSFNNNYYSQHTLGTDHNIKISSAFNIGELNHSIIMPSPSSSLSKLNNQHYSHYIDNKIQANLHYNSSTLPPKVYQDHPHSISNPVYFNMMSAV